jgi:hypothetical protein
MVKKKKYEQPLAFDMSQGMIHGQKVKPLGICYNGTSVWGTPCTIGTRDTGSASCVPMGSGVELPYCSAGTGGSSGCVTGSIP